MVSYLQPELPPIAMTERDCERLVRLAAAAAEKYPATADFLACEIERAHILSEVEALPGLVIMGSEVEFRDDISGQTRRATLVYPDEADVATGKISVLTPIGAALIGLSVSQSIEFRTPGGERRSLTVLAVRNSGSSGDVLRAAE
ncbi:MAG: nucleoside diphosphate kinase regulator [Pseudorhodoplanes sp.]